MWFGQGGSNELGSGLSYECISVHLFFLYVLDFVNDFRRYGCQLLFVLMACFLIPVVGFFRLSSDI